MRGLFCNSGQTSAMGRRTALGAASALFGAAFLPRMAQAWTPGGEVIDVTSAPYNARPGLSDNTSAFQTALRALEAAGGGALIVPPGVYSFTDSTGLSFSGASLSIIGYGKELSIFEIKHTGTAITAATSSETQSITIRDVGFVAATATPPAGAVALHFPSTQVSGWPSCTIENVDFGAGRNGGSASSYFNTALSLTNAWRSHIRTCNYHAANGMGTFVSLNGFCIDNRVDSCSADQAGVGIAVNGQSQGLHVTNCEFSTNGASGTAISTGTTSFNGGNPNLLALFVDSCYFSCAGLALNLYQVNSANISNSGFVSNGAYNGITVVLTGCTAVQFSNCQVAGGAGTSQAATGFYLGASIIPTIDTELNNITFQNISTGIYIDSGTLSTTGRENRLFAPGFSTLIGAPIKPSGYSMVWQAVVDRSGNNTNEVEWVAPAASAPNHATDRYLYTQTK